MDSELELLTGLREAAVAALERAAADLTLVFAVTGDANHWASSVDCERLLTDLRRQPPAARPCRAVGPPATESPTSAFYRGREV